ncbi:MAG: hypothetical protein JWN38_120 [Candidatus Saccharibacteria bacterium]|nr:hypothetical protein [Candidatus Saccharibacteria bacterium]
MKQKDILLLIVIVFISTLFAVGISKVVFHSTARDAQAESVDVITADFPTPDPKYFNEQAVNLTRLIQISGNNNDNPFTGTSQ